VTKDGEQRNPQNDLPTDSVAIVVSLRDTVRSRQRQQNVRFGKRSRCSNNDRRGHVREENVHGSRILVSS